MTTTLPAPVELDGEMAHWLDVYADAARMIAEQEERQAVARERITGYLGSNEVGTVDGVARVRWTFVVSHRLDQAKVKAILTDEERAACTTAQTTRRFSLVKGDDDGAR